MTEEQCEALRIARYALTRVIDVHIQPPGESMPDSLYKAIVKALDEIEEYVPVGDMGDKPIKLALGALREARSRALGAHDHEMAGKIQEAQAHLLLVREDL